MGMTISLILRLVPSISEAKLRELTLTKLAAISLFVRGVDVIGTNDKQEDAEAEGSSEKK